MGAFGGSRVKIKKFDFGAEDARNINLRTDSEKRIFKESYVRPRGFDLDDYYVGKRYFIYGPKGSGKSTLLRFLQLSAEEDLKAITGYYFFQSSFPAGELKNFNAGHHFSPTDAILDDRALGREADAAVFWRLVLLTEVVGLLKRAKLSEGAAANFYNAIEAAKLIARNENVARAHPAIESFLVRISRDPAIEVKGSFKDATVQDLKVYLSAAENFLEDVWLENSPIYLFVDEMEVFRTGKDEDEIRLLAVASLVKAVRDFNERFNDCDIHVIAAVRSEVVSEVTTVLDEVYRIVRDRGLETGWDATVRDDFHPLVKIFLQRMVVQDDQLNGYASGEISEAYLKAAAQKYFPGIFLKEILNLTWFRPRDISLLFDEAKKIDGEDEVFKRKTLFDGILKPLGERLWQDAISGLAVRYQRAELNGIDRMLRGWRKEFTRADFLKRLEDLSHNYDDVAYLSDHAREAILSDLYRVGAIYTIDKDGSKGFFFRGHEMPAITEGFKLAIHQTLFKYLQIEGEGRRLQPQARKKPT